ncbi:MAG: hypothetical protein NTW09_02830 [Candidatus Omnitrophica bacterium]|nr:hypothetical protein [Candidatus Omnitrophota bacterium]
MELDPLHIPVDNKEGMVHLHTKGYYKNLATTSRSMVNNKPYFSDMQRFRIEPTIDIGDNVQIYIAYDNEMIVGDFLRSPDFDLVKQKNEKYLNWLPVQWTLADGRGVYYTTYLYRGYIRYDDPRFQIIVGKQKIDWGRCHFWSPMDLFNPNTPLDIEKDERVGVDAASANASITDFLNFDLVYVPYDALNKSSFAVRAFCRIENYDILLMSGQFKKNNVIGGCVDGYLGGASIRGEFTYTWEHGGADYFHLIGAQVGYDLTPLLKWDNYMIFDLNGNSLFVNPELKYNLKPNLDITLGAQVFWGPADSEFNDYKDIYYGEMKYYF